MQYSIILVFCDRSSKKEHDKVTAKKALFPDKSVEPPPAPEPPAPPPSPPPPQPATPKTSAVLPPALETTSDIGTPRSTSSVESRRGCGPGHPQKELTMPTLADCPPNASKEKLSLWWKKKQSKFWQYKKLSGPEGDEYRCQESAHVKQVLSHKNGIVEDNGDGADDVSILDDRENNGTEDSDLNHRWEKSKEHCKFLGVHIDENLNWNYHMEHLHNKITTNLHLLWSSKNTLNTDSLRKVYYAHVHSHLINGMKVWGSMIS